MNQNEFNAWADDYFAPETNRLNSFIPVQKLQSDFNFSTGRLFGTLKFKDYLKDWAQINGYSFNPSDLQGHSGRIVRTILDLGNSEHQSHVEMVYISSHPEMNGYSIDKSWMDESQSLVFLEEKDGLTLRDQFAMAALPALIEKYGRTPLTATWTYEVADLMLEARKVKGGEVC